ncbi:MAG: hypothetical protein GW778_05580 [Alphaproteobacteria bacterium]|nr:hypothetical protein [Alphaproteobacteria bacterium]
MRKILLTIAILIPLFAQGCSSTRESKDGSDSTSKVIDPTNEDLKEAMLNFFKSTGAPISSTYNFVRFDLNGDKLREAIVMIKSPYGYWCGTHGCVMVVMKAHDNGFSLVNTIQPVREPIYISRAKVNGWHNLLVRVSGRWTKTKNVALRFDGKTYPKDPSKLGDYPIKPANNPDFIRVLYDEGTKD